MAFWCRSAGIVLARGLAPAIMSHVPDGGLAIVSKSCQTGRRLPVSQAGLGWASRCQLVRLALNRMLSSSVCRLPVVALVVALYRIFHNRERAQFRERERVPEIISFSLNCDTMQQQLALFRRTSFRIVLSLTACCSCRCCCCRCIVALNKW